MIEMDVRDDFISGDYSFKELAGIGSIDFSKVSSGHKFENL